MDGQSGPMTVVTTIEGGKIPDRTLGFVKGYSVDDIEGFDQSEYDLPVYFPTVGMTDEDVAERVAAIRAEAEASPSRSV